MPKSLFTQEEKGSLKNQVILSDVLTGLQLLSDASIDMALTSPPYWGLRDYGKETETIFGGSKDCSHEWSIETAHHPQDGGGHEGLGFYKNNVRFTSETNIDKASCSLCGAWKGQLGLEPTPLMFIDHLATIFKELKRVLKKEGTFYLNIGDTYYTHTGKRSGQFGSNIKIGFDDVFTKNRKIEKTNGWLQEKQLLGIPERLMIAMQDDGWILRNNIIWHKPNCMPESVKDRYSKSYEVIYFFSKSRKYYFNLDAIREPFSIDDPRGAFHPDTQSSEHGIKRTYAKASEPFNRRIRDCTLGHEYGPQWKATEKEITAYKGKFEGYGQDSELFGSPSARNERKRDGSASDINQGECSLNKQGHSGYFDKEGNPLVNSLGKNPGDHWSVTTQPYSEAHFATFPPMLCVRPILSCCPPDGIVLDPFAGSGTTLTVAKILKRNYLGIEINPKYLELINSRLAKVTDPMFPVLNLKDAKKAIKLNGNGGL
jgi:DNA modification methylase